jgi:hypothetical protein
VSPPRHDRNTERIPPLVPQLSLPTYDRQFLFSSLGHDHRGLDVVIDAVLIRMF